MSFAQPPAQAALPAEILRSGWGSGMVAMWPCDCGVSGSLPAHCKLTSNTAHSTREAGTALTSAEAAGFSRPRIISLLVNFTNCRLVFAFEVCVRFKWFLALIPFFFFFKVMSCFLSSL